MEPLPIFVSVCLPHSVSRQKEFACFVPVITMRFSVKQHLDSDTVGPEEDQFGSKLSLWTTNSQISMKMYFLEILCQHQDNVRFYL